MKTWKKLVPDKELLRSTLTECWIPQICRKYGHEGWKAVETVKFHVCMQTEGPKWIDRIGKSRGPENLQEELLLMFFLIKVYLCRAEL